MKFRTLANEKTRYFYTHLKKSYIFGWYWPKLVKAGARQRLSSVQRRDCFKINQVAFFKKHFWFHFKEDNIRGWIPVKHFRKNYCRLALTNQQFKLKVAPDLACAILMCLYVRPESDFNQMINQYREDPPIHVDDFFSLVADQVDHFKNVSHKSMRRIRSQIWKQRPVVMKLILHHQVHYVIIIGFNRRIFFYLTPTDFRIKYISQKQLIKAWQQGYYRAFSC